MGFGIQNWLQSMCGNLFRCFSQIQTSSACPLWSFCFEMFWKDCSREYSCLAKIIRNKIAELSSHLFFLQQPQGLLSKLGKKKLLVFSEITPTGNAELPDPNRGRSCAQAFHPLAQLKICVFEAIVKHAPGPIPEKKQSFVTNHYPNAPCME